LTGRVLIAVVDDDDSLRSALVSLVRSLDYEAHGFGSAEEFLKAGEPHRFSCIISDIQMPGMSGIDLKRHLTAQDVPTPVIMISARPEPGLKERAMASGAVSFLRKPFDVNALIDCIERALRLPS
jgi:FixJ family two-component response regulator